MVKSDINLIPKKKKVPLSVTLGILFGVIILALIVFAGITLPSLALQNKQDNLDSLKNELSGYSNIETEFQQKIAAYDTLQKQQANYNDFVNADKQTLEVMQAIMAATPETVTITEQYYDGDKVVLIGAATNDIEIAKFEVALRKIALFSDIRLGMISGTEPVRTFDVTLTHPVSEAAMEGGTSK